MGNAAQAALALVDAFFRAVPPNKKKRLSDSEWSVALNRFHIDAIGIRRQFSLGLIGRAIAAYHFQKSLLAAGLDADTVRKVVFSLVLNAFIHTS